MSDDPLPNPSPEPDPLQKISAGHMSARVPEKVSRGIMATGFLAYFGPNEFVIDFLQFIARPPHLAARVVMSPQVAEQFVNVLRENLSRYSNQFGAPPPLPKNPERPRPAQEIYDDLKIPDEQLAGVYCNAIMVGHTPAEFGIDFITSFIPSAVVSARVFLAAHRVPGLIENLSGLLTQYRRQRAGPRPPGGGDFGTAPGIPGFPTPPPPPEAP